jgi:hypothetical protein
MRRGEQEDGKTGRGREFGAQWLSQIAASFDREVASVSEISFSSMALRTSTCSVWSAALVALPAACAPAPRDPAGALPPLQGFWQSEGYGYQFEIAATGDLLRSQVTAVSCIPTWRAIVVARDASSITYRRADSPARFVLRRDGAHRILIHPTETASEIAAHRVPGRMHPCDRPTPNTPASSFDVFAATFAEQYPFFAQRHVDWTAVVADARRKVTPQTKPSELFEILAGMIEPLHDAHTSLEAPRLDGPGDGHGYAGFRMAPGAVDPNDFPRMHGLLNRYLASTLHLYCEGRVAFGMLPRDIAYVRIDAFTGYSTDGSFESGMVVLEQALDAVFAGASRWRGLVIDVRTNMGGADPYALVVAGRLTPTAYEAFAKQARLDPDDPTRWTPAVRSFVRPTTRPSFLGKVVLLTGPDTVSGGETFTQALLERRPAIDRIGQPTQGVFSDVMARRLPNGWTVGVPCERYVTRGQSYDVTGIPPTIEVPLYDPHDVTAGHDTALETAIRQFF